MSRRFMSLLAAAVALMTSSLVLADGLIVPVRHDLRVSGSWAVKYHHVNIKVRDQLADVSIDQAFVNTGSTVMEVEYLFPLPPQAAIDSLTLVVDGKEFAGKILPKDEARRVYESIVRSKKDPALLEYVEYGLYKTSAFPLQPGHDAKVLVHYTDVCKKDHDLVEVFYPLNTEKFSAKPVEDVKVTVDIQAKGSISSVYSPTHDLDVKRPSSDHVTATWTVKNQSPNTDFRVLYQPTGEPVGATVLSYRPRDNEDGYFLMMVSPTPQKGEAKVTPKDLVVVLDRSGSMSGEKFDQAKASLVYILKNLNGGDRFNVIAFSDSIDPFFDALVENNKENLDKTLKMLDKVAARGGTNIHDSLATALKMVEGKSEGGRYIIFLTDGRPTIGTTDENAILRDTTKSNDNKARIFTMGIGYDVNVRLLDRLVGDNRGVSDYIKEKEPLEGKISNLYAKVKNPVMTDLAVKLAGTRTTMTYPQVLPDLFDGGQIVMVGRYDKPGKADVVVTGSYLGKQQSFEYSADLAAKSDRFSYAFVEQVWAVRRVGYLLDQIQLHGQSTEVVDELVKLSKQYGIITPYTSFLADERTNLASAETLRTEGRIMAKGMADSITGGAGQMHASNRGEMNQAVRPSAPGAAQQWGQSDVASYEKGDKKQLASVQSIGNRAFYRRDNQWVDSRVTDKDLAKVNRDAQSIKQFSDEYFALVKANNSEENQILSSQRKGEELVVALRNQVYRILPAEN
ncbi:MAG: VIT domain-containing protein [Phycisphaerae bacterium]|nr:VIT domain-containing protein [Phycisphaerae bacterium]